jgi:hypothetical protein
MGGEYPKGGGDIRPPGAVFLGISPHFERGAILLGGQKSCDNGIGK